MLIYAKAKKNVRNEDLRIFKSGSKSWNKDDIRKKLRAPIQTTLVQCVLFIAGQDAI